nr:hypothetical protein GCM10020241_62920 [Streptoalloteichus tenebrarius]
MTVWEARTPGDGASALAHGQLVPPGEILRPLWRRSLDVYRRVAERTSLAWDDEPIGTLVLGTLVLGTRAEDLPRLRERNSSGDGRLLTGEEVRAHEPAVGPAVTSGLLFEEGRRIHPPAVVGALAELARRAGARVRCGARVVRLEPDGDTWSLLTQDGQRAHGQRVVIAAGLASGVLAASLGLRVPMTGVRGRILLTEPQPPVLRHILGEPVPALARTDDDLRAATHTPRPEPVVRLLAHQRADGCLLLGASWWPEEAGEPPDHDARVLARATSLLPGLRGVPVLHRWSGTRPCTVDGRPVVDEVAPNLYLCCGHGGDGFIAGPGSAALLADLVLGRTPGVNPEPFQYGRWSRVEERDLT